MTQFILSLVIPWRRQPCYSTRVPVEVKSFLVCKTFISPAYYGRGTPIFIYGIMTRVVRALFVKHPRAQSECQNPNEFWRNHSPRARGCFTNNAQEALSLFPLWHETRNLAMFSFKFVAHRSRGTGVVAILFQWKSTVLIIVTLSVFNQLQSHGWHNLGAQLTDLLTLMSVYSCVTWLVYVWFQYVINNVW